MIWILEHVPSWASQLSFLIAIFVFVVSEFLPSSFYNYKLIFKSVGIIVLCFSCLMIGINTERNVWEEKVKELEVKLANNQVESVKENIKIVEKIVTKKQIIKERGEDVVKYINKEVVKYDSKCEIPQEFIKSLNDASEGVK
jgi:hypothetical protein